MNKIGLSGKTFLVLILLAELSGAGTTWGQKPVRQGPPVPTAFCMDTISMNLYHKVNAYRRQMGLDPILLSRSLSYIAAIHARDLLLHHPDRGPCNFHSWSGKGSWTPFCYPRDESKKASVWDKPRELTRYPSKAYEIVYWENNPLKEDTIFMVWRTEEYFRAFLLNTGKWQGKPWNAIGIAVCENYACAWFGEAPDPEGEATPCGKKAEQRVTADISGEKSVGTPAVRADTNSARKELPKDSIPFIYYIIVKTNLSREAAEKLAGTLRTGEYPAARVLDEDQKIRVSVYETTDRAAATVKLREVKRTYKDAWLLKK